jgi:hypothetical protein
VYSTQSPLRVRPVLLCNLIVALALSVVFLAYKTEGAGEDGEESDDSFFEDQPDNNDDGDDGEDGRATPPVGGLLSAAALHTPGDESSVEEEGSARFID